MNPPDATDRPSAPSSPGANEPLARTYAPAEVEPQIARRWTDARAFAADPRHPASPFAIVIPPPNVTAALHMGHALNNTLQDVLIRWRRMAGDAALWMPGTDHAGIATQTVVEKRVLLEEGRRRTDFTRDAFVEKIQAWKDEYEARITAQLKAMGCSCDFDRQRFTMDAVCAAAVREAFFQLFKDGLIYRGKRLVNWDPATLTALADDEVEMQEIDGNFYYMRYPLLGPPLSTGENYVTVATTRPETMLGDTAVAVNPRDPRAAELRGRLVLLPIVNREIPIIEDDYVVLPDPDSDDAKARYASGFLKVTPAHDPNDWEIGQRHSLPVINVMAPDATISNDHGWPEAEWDPAEHPTNDAGFLLGKDRYEARKLVIQYFKDRQLLEETRPYRHSVGHSYRSHVAIEPYLSDQWYVKVTDPRLAGAALQAMAPDQRSETASSPGGAGGRQDACPTEGTREGAGWEGGLRFHPPRYAKTFQSWHENIRDWCISRQLWWGHRIPVWSRDEAAAGSIAAITSDDPDRVAVHREGDRTFVCLREDDPALIADLERAGFSQDPDVLDTWFSSALWPISTMGWPDPEAFRDGTPDGSPAVPEGSALLEKFNPSSVLCTAREIITLWVSRMVMFNLYFRDRLPFADVFIHAMIQDGEGQKMSKSLGNGVDPLDIIHSHGSDAMRYTLTAMTTQTQDVRMPVDVVCPHTGEPFTPKMIQTPAGHRVSAAVQESPHAPGKKLVTSFGVASGQATPDADMPAARNTSPKFDLGRNFANKLWNAVRFALQNLEPGVASPADVNPEDLALPDRWILGRLSTCIEQATQALNRYDFSGYAQALYDFFWRDLCDWYIEATKPTIGQSPAQRQVLASCVDASLRLLHPIMPFITEKLWERLNAVAPDRGVTAADLILGPSELLIHAQWPNAFGVDEPAHREFAIVQDTVGAVREVRATQKLPPRQKVDISVQCPAEALVTVQAQADLIGALSASTLKQAGTALERPADAASAVVGEMTLYVHGVVDASAEKDRLTRRRAELEKQVKNLEGRLGNTRYVEKAPAHLVQETRDQLAEAQREVDAVDRQLAAL